MEWYEIKVILENQHYAIQEDWEQARMITYFIAQVNSKKKLKLEDIIKFPWESDKKDSVDTEITKEDNDRLKRKAEYIQNLLKQKENGKVN